MGTLGASKIVDEQEVLRWFDEGRTYQWMTEEYERKYNIETGISMWSNFRRRRGIQRRINRDDELIPWAVKLEHRYDRAINLLRAEARRRAGYELDEKRTREVDSWLAELRSVDAVVHYDPDTEQGWFYVPRRPNVDTDLIRVPQRHTARMRND